MPQLVRRLWEPDPTLGGPFKIFSYEAFVPDPIADLRLDLPFDLTQELLETHDAVRELQALAPLSGLEAISRQLLRAESVGSSRIEGLQLSQKRLARDAMNPGSEGEVARAVMGNIKAMEEAIRLGDRATPLTVPDLLAMHALLLKDTRDAPFGGVLRDRQNWIGGKHTSPQNAEFIPPPEGEVERLMLDLCDFLGREDVPAVLQAAIAHAQFETIHPFADGNGRTGRALIHAVLRRRGVTPRFVPPVSLVLATNAQRYVDGLTAFRQGDIAAWCRLFIRTLFSAAQQAKELSAQLETLQTSWFERAGRPRKDSATASLIQALSAHPILDIPQAARLAQSSGEAARLALARLKEAGILSELQKGKGAERKQIWEAREVFTLLDDFEWTLAAPTRPEQPRRIAPQKVLPPPRPSLPSKMDAQPFSPFE